MIKWFLRLVLLLLILIVGSYFFHIEFGHGKLTIAPRSASERAKFWRQWGDRAPTELAPEPAAPAGNKPSTAKAASETKKATAPVPVKPKDKISKDDKKQLESILEKEL